MPLHARAHPKGDHMARRGGVAAWRPRGRRLDAQPSCTYGHIRMYFIRANGPLQSHVAVLFFSSSFFTTTYILFSINRTALDETCSALHVSSSAVRLIENSIYVVVKKEEEKKRTAT